jgi:hypothetical protein
MWISKRLILVLLITCAGLFVSTLQAQEEPAQMYLEPKGEGEKEGEPIYTGIVIAYGVKIATPYHVTLKNDTIYINDLPYSPRKKPPGWKPKEIIVTEQARQEHSLIKNISSSYRKYFASFGEKRAQEMILEEYGNNPLISMLEFSPHGDELIIKFHDRPAPMGISLITLMVPPSNEEGKEEKIQAQRMLLVKRVKSHLQKDGLVIYGYSGPYQYLRRDRFSEMNKIILDLKNDRISREEAEAQLRENKVHRKYIQEIIEHLESWD